MSAFQGTKLWFVTNAGLAKDALHLYVAFALFFGACAILGWRIGDWKPVAIVLVAAVTGEVWDIADRVRINEPQNFSGNWHDIWNMMLWPLAITLLARGRRLRVHGAS